MTSKVCQNLLLIIVAVTMTVSTGTAPASAGETSLYAGGVILRRANSNDSVLGFATIDPSRRITSRDVDHDFSGGFELAITKQVCEENQSQVRYFGWFESPSEGSLVTTPGELIQLSTAVPINVAAGSSIDVSADSALHSVETNKLFQISDNIQAIAGVRYLHLGEDFSIASSDSVSQIAVATATTNDLFGGQLGIKANLLCYDRFFLDATGKAGLFFNHAEQESLATTTVTRLTSQDEDDDVAFVGEIVLRGGVELTRAVKLVGGYQGLWLADVALADDQLGATNFFTAGGLSDSGDVFYHGFNIGLLLNY